jgi:hypothetical protein
MVALVETEKEVKKSGTDFTILKIFLPKTVRSNPARV